MRLLYVKVFLWSPVENMFMKGQIHLIMLLLKYSQVQFLCKLIFLSISCLRVIYIYIYLCIDLLNVKLKNSCLINNNNSGYKTLAISCTTSFLWERKRKTWRKVLELYPWWWASRCCHYWSVLFWSELSVIRILNHSSIMTNHAVPLW